VGVAGTPGAALDGGVDVVSPQTRPAASAQTQTTTSTQTRTTSSAQTQMTPPAQTATIPAQSQPGGGTQQLALPAGGIAVFPGTAPSGDPTNGLNVRAGPEVGQGPQVGAGPNVGEGPQVGAGESDAGAR